MAKRRRNPDLKRYNQWSPTKWDARGLGLPERGNWYVAPVTQTRDSDALDQSNFRVLLEWLGGESEAVEVHRFGHWGPGWFEIILVDPSSPEHVKVLRDALHRLENHPVLDEDDFGELEHELGESEDE